MVGIIVQVKEIHFLIVRKIKVMDDPLYIAIQVENKPNGLHIIIDQTNTNWYVLSTPIFLSELALENANVKGIVDEDICNTLMTDRRFLSNILQLLPNILIPIFTTKYPKDICVQMYEKALQSIALG